MARPDPFLNLLRDAGFLPLRMPREDVAPLTLVSRNGKELTLLGKLREALVETAAPEPELQRDIGTASSVQQTQTSKIQRGVGISILGNILKGLTGKACDIQAGFERASTIAMEFGGVGIDRIDIVKLDRYLAEASIHPSSRYVRELLMKGDCGVITAVMRCRRYLVTAHREDGSRMALDLPVLQKAVGAQVKVSAVSEDSSKVVYEGPAALAFGVQAVRLFYDRQGRFTAFDPIAPGSAAVRGLMARPVRVPELFTVEGGFVQLAA